MALPLGRGGVGMVVLVASVLLGCGPIHRSPPLPDTPIALGAGKSPGERAVLRLGSAPGPKRTPIPAIEIPVTVQYATHGTEVALTLVAEGETIEREVYDARPDTFRLIVAADNTFAPPIDLVHYPPQEGESWDWEGKVVYAGISRHAKAHVSLKRQGDDLRSDVAMKIDNRSGLPPLERHFSFGIRPGHGVVWRFFGDVSARKPEGEPWPP